MSSQQKQVVWGIDEFGWLVVDGVLMSLDFQLEYVGHDAHWLQVTADGRTFNLPSAGRVAIPPISAKQRSAENVISELHQLFGQLAVK